VRLGVALGAAALATALVAACQAGGGGAAPSATVGPSGTPSAGERASPAARSPAAATLAAGLVQAGGPPAAYLQGTGLGDPGAAGAQGSFTWNGAGSDAPWIVHPEPVARGAGPWNVALVPRLPVGRWSARWAPVRDGVAGDPEAGTRGTGPSIVVQAPGLPGTWSLQVQASFGQGREAAWYWTIHVLP
jgi:hypothetical protein